VSEVSQARLGHPLELIKTVKHVTVLSCATTYKVETLEQTRAQLLASAALSYKGKMQTSMPSPVMTFWPAECDWADSADALGSGPLFLQDDT
jgi:hypothetical protein